MGRQKLPRASQSSGERISSASPPPTASSLFPYSLAVIIQRDKRTEVTSDPSPLISQVSYSLVLWHCLILWPAPSLGEDKMYMSNKHILSFAKLTWRDSVGDPRILNFHLLLTFIWTKQEPIPFLSEVVRPFQVTEHREFSFQSFYLRDS